MSGAREPVQPLLWHEGMMLAPQHFQQLVLRQEQLVHYHAAAGQPFHWGVANVRIDVDVLPDGLVRLQELEAILPDGLVVRHLIDRDPALEVDVGALREAAGRAPVTIHVAVPAGRSVDGAGGELPRYDVVETPDVADEAGGAEPVDLRRLRPRLSLEVTTAPRQRPPAKFVSMPLLRVGHDGKAFTAAEFVPPILFVGERSALARQVQELTRRAREKAHHLARQGGAGGGRPERRFDLDGIAAGLPALEALLASGRAHPFTLYVELCRYAGLLSTLGVGQVPPVPPRYDHDDPMPAFAEVLATVTQTLDRLKKSLVAVRFTPEGDKFCLTLEPEWTQQRLVVGVRAPTGMSDADVAAWMNGALIATRDRSQDLWNLRVRGAPRRVVESDPELDLVAARGTVLFAVEPDSAFVTPAETLEIWNTETRGDQQRPTDVVLYVTG